MSKRFVVAALLMSTFATVAAADDFRRTPFPMHYLSFLSPLSKGTGGIFTVALFSQTATCDAQPGDALASCVDVNPGSAVVFDHGCQRVSGAGACGLVPQVDALLQQGGVIFEVVCAEPTVETISTLVVRVPPGSVCERGDGPSIVCREIGAQNAVILSASCTAGCPTTLADGVTCAMCPGPTCP